MMLYANAKELQVTFFPTFQSHDDDEQAPRLAAAVWVDLSAIAIIVHHQSNRNRGENTASSLILRSQEYRSPGLNISRNFISLAFISKKDMKSEAVKVDVKHTLQIIRGDSASSDEFSSNSDNANSKKVNKVRHLSVD